MTETTLAQDLALCYMAGFAARLYTGREPLEYYEQAKETARILGEEQGESEVEIINWNRLTAFYINEPDTVPSPPLNAIELALNFMIKGTADLASKMASGALPKVSMPFDPKKNIIFIVHEIDAVLEERQRNGQLITLIRSYINSNMGTPMYTEDGELDRGKRMLVFLATTAELGRYLPELTANPIPLTGRDATLRAINNVFGPLAKAYEKDSSTGHRPLLDTERETLADACQGMPYQEREDAISKAWSMHLLNIKSDRSIADWTGFLATIEDEKAKYLRSLPGVTYMPKMSLPTNELPGYEPVNDFINECINLPIAETVKHNLPSMRGLLLVGAPGTGKTEFAKSVARKANAMLIGLSLGEVQSKWVGDSEERMRTFLSSANQMGRVVVFVDEIDKAGVGSISDGTSGGNQSFTRMIGMLLTDMTDPNSKKIWVFAANYLVTAANPHQPLIPDALIRAGRIDERYFVDVPDEPIRANILRVIAKRYNAEFESEEAITDIAGETEGFVGSELNDLVIRAVRHMIIHGRSDLSGAFCLNRVGQMTPLSKQPAFQANLEANRQACSSFTVVGRSRTPTVPTVTLSSKGTGRRERGLSMKG